MHSVKQKTSFDAFYLFSQYFHAIAFAIGMTDAWGGPSAYLVNHLWWAFDGSIVMDMTMDGMKMGQPSSV